MNGSKCPVNMSVFVWLLLTILLFGSVDPQGDNVIIKINNGRILGETSVTEENTTFYAFRGIPYAVPPIGELRFSTPLPAKNWAGTYNSTYERSECTSGLNSTVLGSEDCLYLNVYTTKLPSQSDANPKLPVIVWIHGGGFAFFSGNLDLHGADRFLNQQVIVVSINYRLGIFGFISTMDPSMPGNNGLKDQVLALRWVRDNIGYFGGAANNVTIMGESAGAASVLYLVQSRLAKGLFHKAIAESGTSLNPWSQAKFPRSLAFRVGVLNGILTTNSTTLKNRLRQIDYKTLQRSSIVPSVMDLYDPMNGLPWAPVIEPDSVGAVVTGYCYSTLTAGNLSRVPLLLGFNSLEARDFSALPFFLFLDQYNLFPYELAPYDMNATPENKSTAGNKIRQFYFNNNLILPNVYLDNYVSDNAFVRGAVKTAVLMSQFVNVFLYRFAFTGGVAHRSFEPEGAIHTEELQFLWLSNTTIQTTPAAILTSDRMIKMWTDFAETGNPTPYLNAIVNVTWPVVNASGGSDVHYLNIDTVLEPRVNPQKYELNFWDNLYRRFGNSPFNTY